MAIEGTLHRGFVTEKADKVIYIGHLHGAHRLVMADGLRAWRGTKANDGGRSQMRVSEAMTREVRVCKPQHSIRECAKAMADMDVGVPPVPRTT